MREDTPGQSGLFTEYNMYFYAFYILGSMFAVGVFYIINERVLAFYMAGAGVAIMFGAMLVAWRERKGEIGTENVSEGRERPQSPHYIPELDPANPKRSRGSHQALTWFSLIGGLLSLCSAAAAWQFDMRAAAAILAATGVILLSPLLTFWDGGF